MPHQKISNGTVIMVQEEFVKAWYYCYQGLDSMLVEVGSTTYADIIKEFYILAKFTTKFTTK
jgi:hypothetical protein